MATVSVEVAKITFKTEEYSDFVDVIGKVDHVPVCSVRVLNDPGVILRASFTMFRHAQVISTIKNQPKDEVDNAAS